MVTEEYIKSILNYDPYTGLFKWSVARGRNSRIDSFAGGFNVNGYARISIDKKTFLAHRLAWLCMTGKWPILFIDHINGVKHDNRWCNLREATATQNGQNKSVAARNITGAKGVSKSKNGKFRVYLCLGSYDTVEEAKKVYDKAAKDFYGEFYRA